MNTSKWPWTISGRTKGRSFLTMLGIIIGISSVIMIMSIGGGAKTKMSDALNAIAGGQIYVYSNTDGGTDEQQINRGRYEWPSKKRSPT